MVVVVVSIDSEAPSVVVERDWTIEVVDGHEASPLVRGEESLECEVACCEHCIVVVGAVSPCNVVEIVVDSADVVIVDIIEVVEQVETQSQRVGHTVGEEPCVVAHGLIAHRLCGCRHRGDEDGKRC
jgi:hypothetical protein